VSRSERIVALDILRGLALFGMILVHFHQDMEKPAAGMEDIVGWIIWMGLETKAWATFAFLFGAGFAILMRRLEARGERVVPLYLRRMLGLAIFGVAVQVLFGFQILIEYAIWGVPLLLVRTWSTRALLVLAIVCAAALSVFSTFSPYSRGPYWEQLKKAETEGTYAEAVSARMSYMKWEYSQPRTVVPTSSFVLFLLGLLAVRHRLFDDPRAKTRIIVSAMTFGFASWALFWFVLEKMPDARGFGIISDQWLAFTYIGGVALLLSYRPQWKQRLSPFGTTGRMALTNYVLQAAMISWLASGYGLSLKIRPYYELPATVLVFLVMVGFSTLWLSRFRYGPLERLWRAFTYFSWQSASPVTT
jgi:uncharacterized protein